MHVRPNTLIHVLYPSSLEGASEKCQFKYFSMVVVPFNVTECCFVELDLSSLMDVYFHSYLGILSCSRHLLLVFLITLT